MDRAKAPGHASAPAAVAARAAIATVAAGAGAGAGAATPAVSAAVGFPCARHPASEVAWPGEGPYTVTALPAFLLPCPPQSPVAWGPHTGAGLSRAGLRHPTFGRQSQGRERALLTTHGPGPPVKSRALPVRCRALCATSEWWTRLQKAVLQRAGDTELVGVPQCEVGALLRGSCSIG